MATAWKIESAQNRFLGLIRVCLLQNATVCMNKQDILYARWQH